MTTELSSDWRHTLCTCMSPYLCSVSLFSVPTVQPVFLWACLNFVSQKGRLSAVMSNSGTNVPLVQMRIMFSGILASTLRPGHTITVGLHIGVHFIAAYITISLVSFSAASPQKHAFYPPLMSRSDQQRIVENVCNHNLRAEI